MIFGKNLKKLRKKMSLSQEELGKAIGQTKSNISKYENGKLEPSLETISILTNFFNISPNDLLGEEGKSLQNQIVEEEVEIDGFKMIIQGWIKEGKTPKQVLEEQQLLKELKEKLSRM